jgi:hypothetical protein
MSCTTNSWFSLGAMARRLSLAPQHADPEAAVQKVDSAAFALVFGLAKSVVCNFGRFGAEVMYRIDKLFRVFPTHCLVWARPLVCAHASRHPIKLTGFLHTFATHRANLYYPSLFLHPSFTTSKMSPHHHSRR